MTLPVRKRTLSDRKRYHIFRRRRAKIYYKSARGKRREIKMQIIQRYEVRVMLRGVIYVQTNVSRLYLLSLLECRLENASNEILGMKF